MSYSMAKWSRATKRKVKSYRAYKTRLKKYSRETGTAFKPVPYAVFSEKYNERAQKVESGERKTFGSIAYELIKKENRPEFLYNEYKKRLSKRSDYLIERGLTPDDSIPLSYAEFVKTYAEYYSDFKKEIEQGERKYMGDVVGSIVSDQVYKISGKQFKATYEAVIEWNQKHPDRAIDLGEGANEKSIFYQMKVRTMDFSDEDSEWSEWFDIIREKREELFKQGKSAKEVRKEISRTFYGSK